MHWKFQKEEIPPKRHYERCEFSAFTLQWNLPKIHLLHPVVKTKHLTAEEVYRQGLVECIAHVQLLDFNDLGLHRFSPDHSSWVQAP